MIELTKEQKAVLEFYKVLGARWFAIDEDGREHFYNEKPERTKYAWAYSGLYWRNQVQEKERGKTLGLCKWEDEPMSISKLLGANIDVWRDVPIDTQVEVFQPTANRWAKRYFAGVEDERLYCFASSGTSWSSEGKKDEVDFGDIRLCE